MDSVRYASLAHDSRPVGRGGAAERDTPRPEDPRRRVSIRRGRICALVLLALLAQVVAGRAPAHADSTTAGAGTGSSAGPGADSSAGPGAGASAGPSAGAPLIVESISVDPPGREAELLVRRHLLLRIGQAINPATLIDAREQLASTGLFTDVDLYTARGSRPGVVEVVVAATPSHRLSLETGLGFEPLRGWFLNVLGVRRTGLFGRGGTARASWRSGLRTSGFYTEVQVPGTLPARFDLLFDLEAFNEDWTVYDRDKAYQQRLERMRLLLGLQRTLGPDCEFALRTGYARVLPAKKLDPRDDTPMLPADSLLPRPGGFLHLFQAEGGLYRDRLDRTCPWQKGSWIGLAVRGSVPNRGPAFWGWEVDVRAARPIAGTRAIAARIRAAGTDPGTPYFLRPVVGGTGSLRGFAEAGLSGPLGARALWQASAEWRQPLAGNDPLRPRVIGTLFADIGDHWTAQGERHGIAASLGYGALFRIRWLQTLNVEVAYPLTVDPTGSPVALRLSLGRSF